MGMQSGEVTKPPEDFQRFRVWAQRILTEHRQDLLTLFESTTDFDAVEKHHEEVLAE